MTRIHDFLSVIAILCGLVFTAACGHKNELGTFVAVDADGWFYGDTLKYELPVTEGDSVWRGDIALAIRHSAAYPYSNIWVELSYPRTEGNQVDTFNLQLADLYGNWLGRGMGLSFQRVDTVIRNISLPQPADFSLRHIMRSDKLTDIEQVGLIFLPIQQQVE